MSVIKTARRHQKDAMKIKRGESIQPLKRVLPFMKENEKSILGKVERSLPKRLTSY